MKFRVFAMAVFSIGLLACVMSLLLKRTESNPEFAAATTVVTDENHDDVVLASEKPVVLDFYGDYCPACRQLETELLPVIEQYSETAVFARVNVQQAPELIQRYGIRVVPTLVMVHQGELLLDSAGLSALPPLQAALEKAAK